MTDTHIRVDWSERVATVTMNAPALTVAAKEALREALLEIANDATARAVVLAGSEKAFCLGQDLGEHSTALEDGAEAAFDTVSEHYSPIVRSLMTMPKPVIAAVGGVCVGAGLGLALACDYRVFAADAKLGTAFTGIGLTFDSGLSFTLPRAVGDARAKELILFGRMFSADAAISWGIAGESVDRNQVLPRAQELAEQLALGPTVAYAESKQLILEAAGRGLDSALEAESVSQTRCGATDDHLGAVDAFLRRLKPEFCGR